MSSKFHSQDPNSCQGATAAPTRHVKRVKAHEHRQSGNELFYPLRPNTFRKILNPPLLSDTDLADDDGHVAITFIMAQIASLDVVSFSGADHAEKLGVGLLTVDSGKPVVAVRDLPGDVFLGPGGPC
ncbi:hypothetical protein SNK04_011992 [Fusarium graminearum]